MKQISYIALAMLAVSCGSSTPYDAQGTFEATEVVVSSEATGRILDFNVEEGMPVTEGAVVGEIDSLQLHLQRKQLSAQLSALTNSRPDIQAQAPSSRPNAPVLRTCCAMGRRRKSSSMISKHRFVCWRASSRLRFRPSTRIRPPSTTMRRPWKRRSPLLTTASPSAASSRPLPVRCW